MNAVRKYPYRIIKYTRGAVNLGIKHGIGRIAVGSSGSGSGWRTSGLRGQLLSTIIAGSGINRQSGTLGRKNYRQRLNQLFSFAIGNFVDIGAFLIRRFGIVEN